MEYYKSELNKLYKDERCTYFSLQIRDGHSNKTKWLSLNNDSIDCIIEYLNQLRQLTPKNTRNILNPKN